jgi:hypothetical protein
MGSPLRAKPAHSRAWRSEPAAWLCLILASVVLISLAVGIGAEVVALGRWMSATCGEWAPPSSKNDPRCDGSLYYVSIAGFRTAKWSAGGLCLASVWLIVRIIVRKRRADRAAKADREDAV